MDPLPDGPRRIATLEDVESLLSVRVSFEEALDCVRVARIHQAWDLVERSAMAALESVGMRHVAPGSIEEAAASLAAASIRRAQSLEDLPDHVHRASDHLATFARRSVRSADQVESVRQLLSEVLLLLGDDQPASSVSLCARLRKLDRPDLGRIAATRALGDDGAGQSALTTRGCAAIDLFDLESAEADLTKAWSLGQSSYVANAMSRLRLTQDRVEEAMEWATTAVHLAPSAASWQTLLVAAKAAGDEAAFQNAIHELQMGGDRQLSLFSAGLSERWPLYLAGLAMARAGRLDDAENVAAQLETEDYRPAKRLRVEIAVARRAAGRRGPKSGAKPEG